MSSRCEYRPVFPSLIIPWESFDRSFPSIQPLPEEVKQTLYYGRDVPQKIFIQLNRHIDAIVRDQGVKTYLGSIRRQFKMFNIVPSPQEATDELCLLSGINDPNGSIRSLVDYWQYQNDCIFDAIEPIADTWANWYAYSTDTCMTPDECFAAARQIAKKILTFNWNLDASPPGENLVRLMYGSLKIMLFHWEQTNNAAIEPNLVAGDMISDSDERMSFELVDSWSIDKSGMPEPDRFYFNGQGGVSDAFMGEETGNEYSDSTALTALPKVPLSHLFSALSNLSNVDQYLLLHYFGYFGPYQNMQEFCTPIGVHSAQISKSWQHLYQLLQYNQSSSLPLPAMIRQAENIPALRQEVQNAHEDHYSFSTQILQSVDAYSGIDNTLARLDPNAQEFFKLLLHNIRVNTHGQPCGFHTTGLRSDIEQFMGQYLENPLSFAKRIFYQIIVPQLRGEPVEPVDWRQYTRDDVREIPSPADFLCLDPRVRDIFTRVYIHNVQPSAIAREKGVSRQAIDATLRWAWKKIEKNRGRS